MKRAIVIPDQHFPIHDESAVKVVLKAIEFVKPDIFINLGDVGEWSSVSGHRYKRRKRPPLEYQLPEIDEEVKKLQNTEISDREFQKLQNTFENRFVNANSSVSGIAESLATYSVLYENTDLINKEIEIYRSITPKDVKRVANEYLKLDARAIISYLPKTDDVK